MERIDATNINQYLRNQKIIALTGADYPTFVEELKTSLLAFASDPVQQEKWSLLYQPLIHPIAAFCVSVSGWMREFHPAYRRYYENTHTCCRMLKDFMDSPEGALLNAALNKAFNGNCDVRTGYYGELEVAATFHKSIYALLSPEQIREFLAGAERSIGMRIVYIIIILVFLFCENMKTKFNGIKQVAKRIASIRFD